MDDLRNIARGLRFFQQIPDHLLPTFLAAMTLHKIRAESIICKEGDEGDSFAVIMKGTIAVYAKRPPIGLVTATMKQNQKNDPNLNVSNENNNPSSNTDTSGHILEGDVDHSAPSSPRASLSTLHSSSQPLKRRRQFAGATGGSISVPSASVNPSTGSISLPNDFSPLTSLKPPTSLPTEHTFSLVVNPKSKSRPSQQQRGISLVPGWVTPPSSDEDDTSESDSSSNSETELDDGLTSEERTAQSLLAVERARAEVRAKLESEQKAREEAEMAEILAEEQRLQHLEDLDAQSEMVCLTTLHECDCFGLLTILESAKRSATLIALDDTELAVLTRNSYEEIMKQLNMVPSPVESLVASPPQFRARCHIPSQAKYVRLLRMPAEHREDRELNYLIQPLRSQNRLLQMLDTRSLQLVASAMKLLVIPKSGVILQKESEEANWIYVIVKGSLSEHIKGENRTRPQKHESNTIESSLSGGISSPSHRSPSTSRLPYDPAIPQSQSRRRQLHTPSRHTYSHRTLSPANSRTRGHSSPARSPSRKTTQFSPSTSSSTVSTTVPSTFSSLADPTSPNDLRSMYGPCTRLILTGDMTLYPDRDIQDPELLFPIANSTLITREPCILAKLSVDYLSHILLACVKPLKHIHLIRAALLHQPEQRDEFELEVLDTVLKQVGFFQFKPPVLRKALCRKMTLTTFTQANQIVYHQDQLSDTFHIILSGSVSIHQLPDSSSSSTTNSPLVVDEQLLTHGLHPHLNILNLFGPCLSLGRPGSNFGDREMISTLPRNLTIITRGPVELMTVTRKDYLSVFVPVLDEMQYHAAKALQLLSRPQRTPAIVSQLVDVLKHVSYFADMPVSLRTFAIKHMEIETVEGDTVIFLEDDEPDYMYIVMSGSVGVYR